MIIHDPNSIPMICPNVPLKHIKTNGWLVVSNIFGNCPFHIWDVILPMDEVHDFSRW